MAGFKVAENTQLLVTFRDNILAILSHMENMGGVMDQMPQLPVRWAEVDWSSKLWCGS